MPPDQETPNSPQENSQTPATNIVPPSQTQPSPTALQQAAQTSTYAGFWVRYSAYVIDFLVFIIPVELISALISFAFAFLTHTPPEKVFSTFPTSIVFQCTGAILAWTYFVYFTAKHGATLGKFALKLKVVSEDGSKLTYGQAFMREVVGKTISGLILLIGYIIAAFSSKKQALHDHIAGTEVIMTKPATGITKLIVFLTIFAPILPIIIMLIIGGFLVAAFSNSLKNTQIIPKTSMNQELPNSASSSSTLKTPNFSNQFNPLINKYAITISTVSCNALSCIVSNQDQLTGYLNSASSPKIQSQTTYDVFVCTPDCGIGTRLPGWDRKKCTAGGVGTITVNLQNNTCY